MTGIEMKEKAASVIEWNSEYSQKERKLFEANAIDSVEQALDRLQEARGDQLGFEIEINELIIDLQKSLFQLKENSNSLILLEHLLEDIKMMDQLDSNDCCEGPDD